MTFYEIEFPLAALSSEAVEAALLGVGASSITFVDRGDEPVLEPKPGEMRLWRDTLVRALFQESSDAALNLDRLAAALGPHITQSARVRAVQDQVWERAWLTGWKSMRFGRRLWVCPRSAKAPEDPQSVVVRLDPGLAFGTGTHPTTALCLQILDSLPIQDRSAIDYGCGSGILGIAALKLGASHVTAVDLDPQALIATRDNAARNLVDARILVQGIEADLRPAHCVMCNILAGPLIELAPRLTLACESGGHLLLSGLLKTQAYAVKAAYASGFDMVQVIERDEWCCIYARRCP
ncbi:MAG TPA: 50S ribosomal protein L11 methyltransferase [Steroidobacteraceae bacterium]|jgi:ribosomal protein L11 methyltransferase|nr:50S ribosomal protein L11 methyltransferase [Steroidobacteraceae bacterium]